MNVLKFLMIFIIMMKETICLSVVEVIIPAYRVRGESAVLECNYGLDKDTLYSVKWYKDNDEFYRYLPRYSPPYHSYKIDGIKVDHHHSDDKKVTLKAVTLKSSGIFRCEVSAEAPSFASAHGEGRMEVIYLPKDGPHISGQEKDYQIGDILSLNCTSGRSYPAALLQWYINEEKIADADEVIEYSPVTHQHGLVTAILGLRLPLVGRHFREGALKARCVASVSPVLWTADRESLLERVAPLIDNREALVLVRSISNSLHRGCNLWPALILVILVSFM